MGKCGLRYDRAETHDAPWHINGTAIRNVVRNSGDFKIKGDNHTIENNLVISFNRFYAPESKEDACF